MTLIELQALLNKGFNCEYWRQYRDAYTELIAPAPQCNCNCSGGTVYNRLVNKLKQLKEKENEQQSQQSKQE